MRKVLWFGAGVVLAIAGTSVADNISQWNITAASNNSSPPNGAPEGMAPSTVNDVMREIMAAAARWYQDTDGGLVTGGSGNSFTITTNNAHASLGAQSFIVFRANRANTGASTLNVDGLGAKSLRFDGSALAGAEIVANKIYVVAYNSNDDAYDLQGFLPIVPLTKGGTGATTAAAARTNLGLGSIATVASPVPVANGSTAATDAATARTNLGAAATSHSHATSDVTSGTFADARI